MKTLKKAPSAELVPVENRPALINMEVHFGEGNRKVTPADLERAAEAAAAALRTSLEGRTPAYSVASVNVEFQYGYVLVREQFKA